MAPRGPAAQVARDRTGRGAAADDDDRPRAGARRAGRPHEPRGDPDSRGLRRGHLPARLRLPTRQGDLRAMVDTAIVTALAAVGGSVLGGVATLTATAVAQRDQGRRERLLKEQDRREGLYV